MNKRRNFLLCFLALIVGPFILVGLVGLITGPANSPSIPSQVSKSKKITYEIVERWSIPGGEGKAVFISPDYLKETDMTALGEKLKNDTKGDRDAIVMVFSDKQAALLWRRWGHESETEKLSAAEEEFMDKHNVGAYHKNSHTGYDEFTYDYKMVHSNNE